MVPTTHFRRAAILARKTAQLVVDLAWQWSGKGLDGINASGLIKASVGAAMRQFKTTIVPLGL
jgi:hypothetical protein